MPGKYLRRLPRLLLPKVCNYFSRDEFLSLCFRAVGCKRSRRRNSTVHDRLSFLQDAAQMVRPLEALRVDFIDVFGSGGACCEPSALGYDFYSADGSIVARRMGKDGFYLLVCQFGQRDWFG